MKTVTLMQIAVRSIAKNKMRTLLTVLGVVIGVAAVIVMVAVGYGASRSIQNKVNNLGTNMIVLTAGSTAQAGVSQGAQTINRLSIADVDKLTRESTLLAAVSPVVVTRTQVIGGAGNWRTTINGVATNYAQIPRLGHHQRRPLHRRRRARDAQGGAARQDRRPEPVPRQRSGGRPDTAARCALHRRRRAGGEGTDLRRHRPGRRGARCPTPPRRRGSRAAPSSRRFSPARTRRAT